MAAEHLLALDAGTSGARCLIARPGDGPVAVVRREWSYETPPEIAPLGRSFDAEMFWSTLCEVTRQALAQAKLSGSDIAAVGVTSQRLGLVVIDGDGRSLHGMPNVDARAVIEGFSIDGRLAERVYGSTGKLPSLLLAPAKLQWLRNHDEAAWQRAVAVLAVGDWVAYRLTGELAAERSLAGDCGLLEITSRERDEALLRELDVPPQFLQPLVSAGDVMGKVTPQAADETGLAVSTPVVIAGGDTQCALLGMGVEEVGEAGISAGSSCPVQQVTAEARLDPERRTWAGLHVLPERWVVESNTGNAGEMWQWWCELLLGKSGEDLAEAASLVAQASPGSQNVFALLGPATMNAGAMGLHLGGVLMTTPLAVGSVGRAELLRAALENIAYALRGNLEQAERVSERPAQRVTLGGGMTLTAAFPRILADVLGRPIEVAPEVDASALGAAILAARAVGMPDASLRPPMQRLEPEPPAVETYQRQYERWQYVGEKLDEAMQEMP